MENTNNFYSKIQLLLSLLYNGYLKDLRLFKAFLDVRLDNFIPKEILPSVRIYDDAPVLFYYEKERPENLRTVSAPHMITIMLQNLILNENDDLLILGAKSGYIAALAHKLAPKGKIVILEANSRIAKITQGNLERHGLSNKIQILVKNPLNGLPEMSPWKKILVTGAIRQEKIYPLLDQLDHNYGVLFAPIGEDFIQVYTQVLRVNNHYYGKKHLSVRFTPLITQIELDELRLITDIDEIEEFNDSKSETKEHMNQISITYTKDIIEDINLEPKSKEPSIDIHPKNIFLAFLENMNDTIEVLKNVQDLEQWTNFIENCRTIVEIFRKYKRGIKVNVTNIEISLNQIKSYLIVEKNIELDKKFSEEQLLNKKIDLFQKQIKEIEKLQKQIKIEMNKIKDN
ncbi:MAG: protein-L-isoaspartate O-methyltransferase [Candidatus Heimdallarchaeota archaeon]